MIKPSDEELLMFQFGEDLGPEHMAAIAAAIAEDPLTARRYAELRRLLDASGQALSAPEPDPQFESRIWRQLRPRVQAQMSRPERPGWLSWLAPALALAASVGLGLVIGLNWRESVPEVPAALTASLSDDGGQRVLAAHLSQHLSQTERLLRVAKNGDDVDLGALAGSLIEGNRLYAAAAERAGKPVLAQFLIELEPVLLELANDDADGGLGGARLAQEQIRSRDLLYRLQALEALQGAATQRL